MAEETDKSAEQTGSEPDEVVEDAPKQEAAKPSKAKPAEQAADVVAEAPLTPKERRRRKRSAHSGPAAAATPVSIEERVARRAAKRQANAATRRRFRAGRGAKPKGSGVGTPPAERRPGLPKVRQGIVVSNKAEKTISVRVESARRHPTYEKIIRRSKVLHAHDERNEAGPGDLVSLVETRPMSKTKRWRLSEILERAR